MGILTPETSAPEYPDATPPWGNFVSRKAQGPPTGVPQAILWITFGLLQFVLASLTF